MDVEAIETNMREWQKGILEATPDIPTPDEIQKIPLAAITVGFIAFLLFLLKPPFLLQKKRLYESSSLHWPLLLCISCVAGLCVANASMFQHVWTLFMQDTVV